MGKTVLAVLASLGIGIGIGYVLNDGADVDRTRAPTHRSEPQPEPDLRPEASADLVGELNKLPVPDYPAGAGTITGTVRDEEGRPVQGVTIRAIQHGESRRVPRGRGAPDHVSLEETVRRAVKSYHWRRQTTVDAVTDSAGKYVLKGLTDRKYQLTAYRVRALVKPAKGIRPWNVEAGASVDWVVSPIVVLPVRLLLPDGSSPDEAWLTYGNDNAHWTSASPDIELPPGRHTLKVSLRGDSDFKSDPVTVVADPDRPPEQLTIQMVGRPGIRGSVTFEGGVAMERAYLFALRFSGAEAPTHEQLVERGRQAWLSKHSGDRFSFMDLPKGRYLIGVGSRRSSILATIVVDVVDAVVRADLTVGEIDPKSYVLVRVTGPDGRPIPLKDLRTSYRTGTGSSSGGGAWARRKDGAYLVFHHNHEGNHGDGGTYGVELISEEFGARKIDYKLGGKREFDVRFTAPGHVDVTVTGLTGEEPPLTVSLRKKDGRGRWSDVGSNVALDSKGAARLGPASPGKYTVVLMMRSGRHSTIPAARQEIELVAGENEARVAMPTLHVLVVRAKKGTRFRLDNDDPTVWFNMSTRAGDDGRAKFESLPPGRYKLRRTGGGMGGEMVVDVPCGEITFKETQYNALRITITDPDGGLAKAGFVDGDVVIAVDGKEFQSTMEMQMAFMKVMSKEGDTKFTVVRGGRNVEVAADFKAMMTGGVEQGGMMRPAVR